MVAWNRICNGSKDAHRRDFSINRMFYDPLQDKIFDLVQGQRPLEKVEWAYFYAIFFAAIFLQIMGAHFEPRKRQTFLKEHEKEIEILEKVIEN